MPDACWERSHHFDPALVRLADDHYSRRKRGSPQFCPPGEKVVLFLRGPEWPFRAWAGWVWWRPAPGKATRYDGYDGWWCCSFFRNESPYLSSRLISEAIPWAVQEWGAPPHGYDTYVWPEKLRSTNPGYCYLMAGWSKDGWSKDGKKRRLTLPV